MSKEANHRIDAAAFAERYRTEQLKHALLLDVREKEEWEVYRLDDALLIPLASLPEQLDRLNREQTIYVYCAHGVRSVYAVRFLHHQGFTRVIHVDGGLAEVALYLDI